MTRYLSVLLAALVCTVISLSSGAQTVGSGDIKKNAVRSGHIKNGQVKSKDIKNETVQGKDVKDDSLTASDLGPGSVGESELKNLAVTKQKIANDAVGTIEIENGAVTASKLADDLQGRRKYYLTDATFTGATARSACAAGYHMASFFELVYALLLTYDSTLGFTTADMGSGPPSGISGWVRTGNLANNQIGKAGTDNCLAYTTTNGSGTIVGLASGWLTSGFITPEIAPWGAAHIGCNNPFRVWCIED